MRRLLAITSVLAASVAVVAIPAGPASADSASGGSTGGGSYQVQVTLTGSGVGSGGSLTGGNGISGGGGSVSVPSPCGYGGPEMTQQEIESYFGGDKQKYLDEPVNYGPNGAGDFPISVAWRNGIIANWGKKGTWYLPGCDSGAQGKLNQFVADNPPVLVGPGGGGPPQPKVDPKFLEDIAIKAMTLPRPTVGFNPNASGPAQTFVNVPGGTWFWSSWPAPADTRIVTASLGGVSATVVATFNGTTFTSNAGAAPNSVFCRDGGKPYTRGATSSPCNLKYVTSSGSGSYTVTASSAWSATVSSTGNGSRAIQGANMIGQSSVKVGEIQTVNR